MNSRYQIYKDFKEFVQQRDNRSMDDICRNVEGEFKLQAQQSFLREYMKVYKTWDKLVLYHRLGSGKTCTSITMAEEYMRSYPLNKVKVILPARLRTNFIDELGSACANTENKKRYEIYSFEKFKIAALKAEDIKEWMREFTSNSMIIVDEVHNLLSDAFKPSVMKDALSSGTVRKGEKGMNTILFMMLNKFADEENAKFVFLTATPIFDNINQLKLLAQAVKPKAKIPVKTTLKTVIEHLRGKVSYFPGTSINAYPAKEYDYITVPLNKYQEDKTLDILNRMPGDIDDDTSESFMVKQRQITIGKPKINALVKLIKSKPGKHLVYSTFIKNGLHKIIEALEAAGFKAFDPKKSAEPLTFALWDGSLVDKNKQIIKKVVNSIDNIDGKHIKVILGSPSIKEGVSFKHMQHVHIIDPVWNQSAIDQLEGRAIRYCSHMDIPTDHPVLKRKVIIHRYKSVPRTDGKVPRTCDQIIYDDIIPKKYELVKSGEEALKKVSIDRFLFKNLYADYAKTPVDINNLPKEVISPISIESLEIGVVKKHRKSNTCPKKRRPIVECSEEYPYRRKNLQNFDCCYKRPG